MDLGTPAIQSWLRPVSLLREELECGDCLACHPLITSQLEELISTSLLLAQPSNYSAACGVRKLRPRSENLDLQAEPTLRTPHTRVRERDNRERESFEDWRGTRRATEVYEKLISILEEAKQTSPLHAVVLAHDDR